MPIEIGFATVMEGLELGLQGRLSVNTSALTALALEQFSHPVCWLRTILGGLRPGRQWGVALALTLHLPHSCSPGPAGCAVGRSVGG